MPVETPSRDEHSDGGKRVLMDVSCANPHTRTLERTLRRRLIGQDHVVETLTCSFSRVLSGLRDPGRPVLTSLLLGPTGVGKTETARALADTLFGSEQALTQINCEEYAHGHELAKLLGAPPGYVGHHLEPLLSQGRVDAAHHRALSHRTGMVGNEELAVNPLYAPRGEKALSIVLFDEIEKAHPILWNAILGVLEDGVLTLGNNETTDFRHSIVVLTSNVGSRQMSELVERRTVGFAAEAVPAPRVSRNLEQSALAAARDLFPLELLNRFDEILVFSPLERVHLERIFDKFLAEIHERAILQARVPLLIKVSSEAKSWILDRGEDLTLGARPLRRAMESEIVDPLSRLIAAHDLEPGDIVEIERDGDRIAFYRRLNVGPEPEIHA